jgi:copper(I)-binding protein
MKTPFLIALALGLAAPIAAAPIRLDTPWLRETFAAATTGAGYVVVHNDAKRPDTLLGGTTPIADRVELHSMSMDGGIMRMRALPGGVAVPAGGSVALRSGGQHLMLTGLKRPLKRGETIEIRLRFARAGIVPARFRVEAVDYSPPAGR